MSSFFILKVIIGHINTQHTACLKQQRTITGKLVKAEFHAVEADFVIIGVMYKYRKSACPVPVKVIRDGYDVKRSAAIVEIIKGKMRERKRYRTIYLVS